MSKRKPRKTGAHKRTDAEIIDALESLPGRVDIIYKPNEPRSHCVPPLRDQINRFLDEQ